MAAQSQVIATVLNLKLRELLEHGTRYAPLYQPQGNSDHLPMTLCAMAGLGADDEQLEAYSHSYGQRLQLVDNARAVHNWRLAKGDMAAYGSLLGLMREKISHDGALACIDDVLPELLPGLVVDAFHPMIRLGYAVDCYKPGSQVEGEVTSGVASSDINGSGINSPVINSPVINSPEKMGELAAALAYFIAAFRKIPVSSDQIDVNAIIDFQVRKGPCDIGSGRFTAQILQLVRRDIYPLGSTGDLRDCAALALEIFRGTRNFFALHLVTACQALRNIVITRPALEPVAVAAITGAILASHLVLGSPAFRTVSVGEVGTLDPEHAFKYVWACLSEYRAYGNPVYVDEIRLFRSAGSVPGWVAPGF